MMDSAGRRNFTAVPKIPSGCETRIALCLTDPWTCVNSKVHFSYSNILRAVTNLASKARDAKVLPVSYPQAIPEKDQRNSRYLFINVPLGLQNNRTTEQAGNKASTASALLSKGHCARRTPDSFTLATHGSIGPSLVLVDSYQMVCRRLLPRLLGRQMKATKSQTANAEV